MRNEHDDDAPADAAQTAAEDLEIWRLTIEQSQRRAEFALRAASELAQRFGLPVTDLWAVSQHLIDAAHDIEDQRQEAEQLTEAISRATDDPILARFVTGAGS
jgi:hypothetical protein